MGKKMANIYRKHKQCLTSKSQHASQKNSIDQILDQIALKKSCGMKYHNGTFLKIYSHTRFKAQFFLKLGVYFQVHSIQKWSKNGGKEILCLIRHCEEFYASLHSRKSMLCAYIWVAWLRSILLYLM